MKIHTDDEYLSKQLEDGIISEKVGENKKPSGSHQNLWDLIRGNPLQSISMSSLVVAVVTFFSHDIFGVWFHDSFIPSLRPLNVVTTVDTRNPSRYKSYNDNNGTFSPLELKVAVENPGDKRLYLLKSSWIAEVCSFNVKGKEKNVNGEKKNSESPDSSIKFVDRVERNMGLSNSFSGSIYQNYAIACAFIGEGGLLHDDSISPKEALRTTLVLAYPEKMVYYSGGPEKPVDFIRITTFIPSMTDDYDNVSSKFYFSKENINDRTARKVFKAPDSVAPWMKVESIPASNSTCEIEDYQFKHDDHYVNDIIKHPRAHFKIPTGMEVWCKLQPSDKIYKAVNITRSVSETWLRNRTPDK